MNTEPLFRLLSAIQPLSLDFSQALENQLIPVTFPKSHMLLETPHVSDFAYFLSTGFAMSFTYSNGRKSTSEFWKSNQIMVACNSFFERVPSAESIQLMTKCDLLCISYDSVQQLFLQYPEATNVYRIIMNRYYQNMRERILDLQNLRATERFNKLFRIYPDIEQLVSQDSIASYLSITPQSLSRLKRRKDIM